ncbi:MAG: hypothetical protein KC468_07430, partial [Myxococcales bacterium]|nr:hypothetical protein [Myxococcales bacterium]
LDVLLAYEDPRPMGRFRVAIALLVAMSAFSMHQSAAFLFSSAGLLTTEGARAIAARGQFDDVIQPGLWTLLQYPAGTSWSSLHFWDSPLAVHLHLALLYVACLGLALGTWTRYAKWAAFVVYSALWSRNMLSFGGEQVLFIALLMLCLSDCGAACSLDARGRPLRAIPRWPRVLLVLQLIPIYLGNALAKDGLTWIKGHAVHFAATTSACGRFALWERADALAPVFWLANHLTLYFEFGFALVVLRALAELSGPTRPPTRASRAVVLALCGLAGALFVHDYAPVVRLGVPEVFGLLGGVAIAIVARRALATALGRRVFSWVSAPRLWIPLGVLFHVGVFAALSVDVFVLATAAYYLLLTGGDPALTRPRPALPARALELVDVVGVLIASGLVLAFTPWLWAPMMIACLVAMIARARARGVPRRAVLVPAFCALHVAGALLWCLPREPALTDARARVTRPFTAWIKLTHGYQSWQMFAPNTSTREGFLVALGETDDGSIAPIFEIPATPTADERPVLGREKREKILRRLAWESDAAARPWFARYLCREAPPELRAVSLARRSFAALPFGARESTEARRRRFER